MNNQELKNELGGVFAMLTGISVPIGLLQQIGVPIMNAMERLGRCIDAIPDAPADKEQPHDPDEKKALDGGDF